MSVDIFITFQNKYVGFANVFLFNIATQVAKYTKINNFVIK